jgi:hypothetical protein
MFVTVSFDEHSNQTRPMRIALNATKLIEDQGGHYALSERFASRLKKKVPAATIYKWTQRDNIPSKRLVEILYMAEIGRQPVTLHNYITTDTTGRA